MKPTPSRKVVPEKVSEPTSRAIWPLLAGVGIGLALIAVAVVIDFTRQTPTVAQATQQQIPQTPAPPPEPEPKKAAPEKLEKVEPKPDPAPEEKKLPEKKKLDAATLRYFAAISAFLDEEEALCRLLQSDLSLNDFDRNLAKVTDMLARIPEPPNKNVAPLSKLTQGMHESNTISRRQLLNIIDLRRGMADKAADAFLLRMRQDAMTTIMHIALIRKTLPAPK